MALILINTTVTGISARTVFKKKLLFIHFSDTKKKKQTPNEEKPQTS